MKRFLPLILALVALVAACAPTMSSPVEYADKPISPQAGEAYFRETGGGDPYASGMAYPVFLGLMAAYPDILGKDWPEFEDKFGFLPNPDAKGDPKAVPIGFHLTEDPNTGVSWLVANCQLCHADRLRLPSGDVIVPGLGSKRIKPHAYIAALLRIGADPKFDHDKVADLAEKRATELGLHWPGGTRAFITTYTLDAFRAGAKKRATELRFDAALPGRMATIESFTLALNRYRDDPIALPKNTGWAKVPDVRGFPFRETFSYDASGFGSPQALVLEADFLFGARPEWYLTHPHIATSMYLYLKSFARKLPYPNPIDAARAAKGNQVFDAHCAGCHGTYVKRGDETIPAYHEKVIPIDVLGTDRTRLDAVTPAFVDAANALPLTKGYTLVRNTGGYVPPVLLDVWARGNLGHAGQWPTIEVMARDPAARPKKFVVDMEALYDLDNLGVKFEPGDAATKKGTYLYDGTQPGFDVGGHTFLSDLSADDKRAVIEYLKTL